MGEAEIAKLRPMQERYARPDWVRRTCAMGESVGGGLEGARRIVPMDAEAMLETAERSLGGGPFGDFGEPGWRDHYRALVAAADALPLHVVGRLMTRQEILRSLRTRLAIGRAWAQEPAMAEEEIVRPVIVTGPARSGTTITFELLALDPDLRGPMAADALHPIPLDGASEADRLAASECEQELWADVQPEFAAIHELRSDLPVECVTLTTASFCGSHWPMVLGAVPMDPVATYAFEKRLLQLLQFLGPRPQPTWLLKTPGHIMMIDLTLATFPDAWIVQTHRDPAKTMPSTVSTTAMVQWLRTDRVDVAQQVRAIGAAFTAALNSVAVRRREGDLPNRFVDVHFQSLMRDPVETLRRAYGEMERPFTTEHGERIRQYLAEKPKGKFGVHRYTPEEWGFTRSELHASLAPYIDAFGIELEG
ncbi:MAG: sulfotransferase [Myxococcota bacterium]|nr:sulfotransferase [Myxococcales bacterium]